MTENESVAPPDDASTPASSPARPTSKSFKRTGGSTPKKPRPAAENTLFSWMMSSSQLSILAQSLQRFLESRQSDSQYQQSSSSVLHGDSSMGPPSLYFQNIPPQSSHENPNTCFNSSFVLASSYLQLWVRLLEIQWTDPHPLVSKAAKYTLASVKTEVILFSSHLRHKF
jgi:hypothetical protein